LTTYNPPTARPGDARSTRLLHGRDLSPDANIAGYLQSPPLLLTTMRSLPALTNPEWYSDTNGARPISVIRVRVGDLRGSVRQQLARIGQVALAIKKATGLQVDVTAGASPTSVSVDLPAGRFGRPALTLSEPWVKKGVAVAVLTAVDRKSAALFVLILIVTAAFLANGAFAAVRARRHEIGVLRCLGWPRGDIFRLVLGELVVLGLLAGVAGAAVSALAIWLSGLDLPLIRVLLVPPVAVALALLAGFTPAWRAGRGEPLDAVAPAVLSARRTRAVHRVSGLGLSNLRRMPGRAALAAVALAVGVAALTVLLAIQFSFGHEVAGTALGGFVTNQVRGVDYFSAALAIGLGGASVADVLYLNLRERAPEFAALAAMGWRRKHLVRLGWVEGSAIGLIGSMIGAMDTVDQGSIIVGGRDLSRLKERDRAEARRRIGFVFQRFHLLPALTALDNVMAPVLPYRTPYDKAERARIVLAAVGLEDRAQDIPSKLSGGQQQRVAIARALINQPGLLLADEPTGNLDTRTGGEVMDLLLQMRDQTGLTLLIATHDAGIAARCDRVIRLTDGRVTDDTVVSGTLAPEEALEHIRRLSG
jgi:ABC-type lipoprotein export system ATPase subunit